MQKCIILNLEGIIDYWLGSALQRKIVNQIRIFDDLDHLLLLRHNPVITKGYFARDKNILKTKEFLEKKGINIYDTDRGGDVTYHGPGQLIGYPIIELNRKRLKIYEYKSKLCQTLISILEDYGIEAEERHKRFSGIWVGDKKIAAIGYTTKTIPYKDRVKEITMYGFALCVLDEMENFRYIHPCGMPSMKLTNMEQILGKKIDFKELKEEYTQHFARIFKYEIVE